MPFITKKGRSVPSKGEFFSSGEGEGGTKLQRLFKADPTGTIGGGPGGEKRFFDPASGEIFKSGRTTQFVKTDETLKGLTGLTSITAFNIADVQDFFESPEFFESQGKDFPGRQRFTERQLSGEVATFDPNVTGGKTGLGLTPAAADSTQTSPTPFGPSSFTGVSIVDYLKSVGQASDFTSRSQLAKQFGIENYTGTAEQNTNLLGILRNQTGGVGGSIGDEIRDRTGGVGGVPGVPGAGVSAEDDLINKLTTALSSLSGGETTAEEELNKLREERGVGELKETIGTFEEEIGKAQDLLSDLDARIRGGLQREEARLAPKELITGRQAELQAQSSLERGDVLSAIDTLQRGKERAERTIDREESDILTILGLREKSRTQPLEDLKDELSIRKTIRDLTKSAIPDVVSSTFDDNGNLTIVTQNPETGLFSTKSIPGIGKVKKSEEGKIALTELTLLASRAGGENVDGNVYLEERRRSDLNPTEFDKRFGSLLSEGDRERFKIKGPEEIDNTIDEVKSVFQQLRDLGVSRKEAEKQFKDETGAKKISDEIKRIIDSIY